MFDRNKGNKPESSEPTSAVTATETRASSVGNPSPGSGGKASIGATIRIKGDISGDENLLIEGRVEGTVTLAANELVIGKSGKVSADLTAKVVRIDGEVQGDITGKEKVIFSSTSNVKGNIVTPKMTLEEGARFKGSIDIDPAHADGGASISKPSSLDQKTGSAVAGKPS